MSNKGESLANEIIARLEDSRKYFEDRSVNHFQENNNNPLRTGWCATLRANLNSKTGGIKISVACQLFGSHTMRMDEMKLESDISGVLEDQASLEALTAILQKWLDNAVKTEEYGGYYHDAVTLKLGSDTLEEELVLSVTDEKRQQQYQENLRRFIDAEEYKSIEPHRISSNLKKLAYDALTLYPDLTLDKVQSLFDSLIERVEDRHISYVLDGAYDALFDKELMFRPLVYGSYTSQPYTGEASQETLDLIVYLCVLFIQSDRDRDAPRILKYISKNYKYKKAGDIMKFGSGKFEQKDISYKDGKVACIANDVKGIVDIKFASFDAEAYSAALRFLTRLVEIGFPMEYEIKSNVAGKEYLPMSGTAGTTTDKFWRSLEKFPETWPLVEGYVKTVLEDSRALFTYYSDTEEAEAVPVGGYAAMVLGLYAPEQYSKTLADFLEEADYEHALTIRELFDEVYERLEAKDQKRIEDKRYW